MWRIQKPELSEAQNDIEDFVKKGIVTGNDEANSLKMLVEQYDVQQGKVTKEQHNKISSKTAASIHSHYTDTNTGNKLDYIRKDLMKGVVKCPYCAIGFPDTLDHYMPKSIYKALALCRLNLVPMCWSCNHQKSYQHPYNEYIHPYYLMNLKGKIFLVARIQPVDESLDITFSFDKKVIGNEELYNQFVSHWRNMDLDNRLRKSAISFLHNGVLTYLEEVKGLSVSIDILLLRFGKIYGLNDWRTAIVRALSEKLKGKDSTAVMAALASMRPQISDINI